MDTVQVRRPGDAEHEAVADLSVAAYAPFLLGPEDPYIARLRDDEGEFRMLAVSPAAQGRGVGRALVQACAERARRDGLRRIVLSSLTDQKGAHALYGSLGFTRAAARDWSPAPGVALQAFELVL